MGLVRQSGLGQLLFPTFAQCAFNFVVCYALMVTAVLFFRYSPSADIPFSVLFFSLFFISLRVDLPGSGHVPWPLAKIHCNWSPRFAFVLHRQGDRYHSDHITLPCAYI